MRAETRRRDRAVKHLAAGAALRERLGQQAANLEDLDATL